MTVSINGTGSMSVWRWAFWLGAAALLAAPAIAMQFTHEVKWTWFDFAFLGALLAGIGGAFEWLAGRSASLAYRCGVAIILLAAFLLIVVNGAVGIIGDEDNPANLMFGGVLAVAAVGGAIGRFRPHGMARAMVATAVAEILVGGIALAGGIGANAPSWPWDVVLASVFFTVLWLSAAWLFARAARQSAG